MTSIEQVVRLLCVPVAMSLFLLAAQASGGLTLRDTPVTHVAMK
jgi:hypothetical protein